MKKIAILLAVVCLFVANAAAQAKKTDFSGEWKLDVSKSKLGERSRVESMTMKVAQTDKELKVETSTKRAAPPEGQGGAPGGQGGGMGRGGMRGGFGGDGTVTYSLDGKETTTEGAMGGKATLTASFEKDGKLKLTRNQSVEGQMGQMNIGSKEIWELSADGKTLTVKRDTESPRGAMSTEMVFTKN
jgi:hypothetical protein